MIDIKKPEDIIAVTHAVFKEDGILKETMGFGYREGQYQMAMSVANALAQKCENNPKHFVGGQGAPINPNAIAISEAGTGTGKTLAYSIPAALFANLSRKTKTSVTELVKTATNYNKDDIPNIGVNISVHTIALQEQLVADSKLVQNIIQKATGKIPSIQRLSGRSNYFCIEAAQHYLNDPNTKEETQREIEQLIVDYKKLNTNKPVTIQELASSEKISYDTINSVQSSAENCKIHAGKSSPHCDYNKARSLVEGADILITNHNLTALMGNCQKRFTILDEAHTFEKIIEKQHNIATDYTKVTKKVKEIYGKAPGRMKQDLPNEELLNTAIKKLTNSLNLSTNQKVTYLEEPITGEEKISVHRNHKEALTLIAYAVTQGANRIAKNPLSLESVYKDLDAGSLPFISIQPISKTIQRQLNKLLSLTKDINNIRDWYQKYNINEDARWIENNHNNIVFKKVKVELKKTLKRTHHNCGTVTMTSATLAGTKGLRSFTDAQGIEPKNAIETECQSPFDLDKQMQLIIPKDMPAPPKGQQDSSQYDKAMVNYIETSIADTHKATKGKGGTLILCTSRKTLNAINGKLTKLYGANKVITQQIGSNKKQLIEKFKKTPGSILIGVESMWTGIDIPGEALSSVIITKLPFEVPTPASKKREILCKKQGGNAFLDISVNNAIKTFKQGIGRLIRKETDKGKIVILDSRVINSRYSHYFLKGLPKPETILKTLNKENKSI